MIRYVVGIISLLVAASATCYYFLKDDAIDFKGDSQSSAALIIAILGVMTSLLSFTKELVALLKPNRKP